MAAVGEKQMAIDTVAVASVQALMRQHCSLHGKQLYCDKSLDSVHYLPVVHELFPTARAVLIFRHVLDTVVSGLEASTWGFGAYGYAPYVQASPGNTVAALATYWLKHVELALEWEAAHADTCHRVTYETLVTEPGPTVRGIQRFLGVREDLSVLAKAFQQGSLRGPADYKIEHTRSVHADSVGRGKRVPVAMLPKPLLAALNEKLDALGYETLDRGWNTTERATDRGQGDAWGWRLASLMRDASICGDNPTHKVYAVVADDSRDLRWIIDSEVGTTTQGDGDVDVALIGNAHDLVLMLTEEENLGVLLRSGRVRHVTADDPESAPSNPIADIRLLRRILGVGSGDEVSVRI